MNIVELAYAATGAMPVKEEKQRPSVDRVKLALEAADSTIKLGINDYPLSIHEAKELAARVTAAVADQPEADDELVSEIGIEVADSFISDTPRLAELSSLEWMRRNGDLDTLEGAIKQLEKCEQRLADLRVLKKSNDAPCDIDAKIPAVSMLQGSLYNAVQKLMPDQYVVGGVIQNSWGYEQTNVDFWLITKRTKSKNGTTFLTIQRLQAKTVQEAGSSMSGYVTPSDKLTEDSTPMRRKLHFDGDRPSGVSIHGYGWGRGWNGQPANFTCYA